MNHAVFWIESGDQRFIEEARSCSIEIHELMPELERILFTPDDVDAEGFDRLAILPPLSAEYWFLDSIRYFNMAYDMLDEYETCLYLDSDLDLLAPFPELFRMTERFDVVAAVGSRRITRPTVKELPECFPEYELGVILFKRCDVVKEFLNEWERLHWTYPSIYGNNDQPSFREAVWNTPGLKVERIPPEYALRWPFGVFMSGEVKVLHGREEIDRNFHPEACSIKDVKRIVNEHLAPRIWSPRSKRWSEGVVPSKELT